MIPPPPPPPPPFPQMENRHYSPEEKKTPSFVICLNILNVITQLLLGTVACGAFMAANHFGGSMKQHIYLCVIGYVILMSQAILSMSPTSWTSSLKYEDKKTIHWSLQILGSALAVSGSIVRIVDRDAHFESAHGILGILALVFTCLSLFGGIVNLFSTKNQSINPKFIKICHSGIGCVTISLAFLCLVFGFDTFAFRFYHFDTNAEMMMAFTVVALIGTLIPPFVNIIRRIKN